MGYNYIRRAAFAVATQWSKSCAAARKNGARWLRKLKRVVNEENKNFFATDEHRFTQIRK
jgi:hypothetical protein